MAVAKHADAARAQWRQVADQVRPKLPKLAALLDEAEEDALASMSFPKEHRAKRLGRRWGGPRGRVKRFALVLLACADPRICT